MEVNRLSFLGQLTSVYIPSLRVSDIIEIFILIFMIYKVIIGLRNTRAMIILKGILVLFIFYNIAYLFSFDAILVLFQSAITLCIFAIIVVFQPEMRKFLEQIGTKNITGKFDIFSLFRKNKEMFKYYSDKSIVELTKSCYAMGSTKTGALIVLERDIPLLEYVDTGISVNADISSQLIINIFEKNTPLHDGAVIQSNDKIVAATCYLPLSQSTSINKNMGTRHRAAIGVSEVTDCLVIVVSEETGNVSLVVDGKIHYNLAKEALSELLYKHQIKKDVEVTDILKVKKKQTLKSFLFTGDVPTWIVSTLIGLVGWVLLMNVANPLTTVNFKEIPIEVINTTVIENIGKTYEFASDISDGFVDVKVTDRRSVVDQIKKEDIVVLADLTKLSYVNAVPLTGYVEGYPSTVVDFLNEETVVFELDAIISKEVNIELETYYNDDSLGFVPELTSEVESVVISGGKSKIDTVDKIIYTYDVSTAKQTYSGVAEPMVYDRNGNVIPNDYFEFNVYKVSAVGDVYAIKKVPIEIILDNQIINGYKINTIDYIPKDIKISGDSSNLEKIENISVNMTTNLHIDMISNNQLVKTIKISEYLPKGTYFVGESDEIAVTIEFEALKTKTITFSKDDVSLIGLIPNAVANLEENEFSVVVSGADSVLSKISKDTIKPYIDVSGLLEGKYNMIVQFDGLDSVILTSNISVKLIIARVED